MRHINHLWVGRWALPALVTILGITILLAQDKTKEPPPHNLLKSDKAFSERADHALQAMTRRAEELKIKGVAVVAFFEGDRPTSWSSKMAVVGTLKNSPSQNDRGANLLAIAYSKAAEMADTLKNSGSGVRPPMTGEFGWQGGLIIQDKSGYWIAAFSGGPSEDDLKVSQTGLDILAGK